MMNLLEQYSSSEIVERTFPFHNIEIGETFVFNYTPYIRIRDRDLFNRYTRFEYNAVSMLNGACVHFANETTVIRIDNPIG